MESTRRLSLTLLLVTPIIAARRLSFEDLGLSGAQTTWGEVSELSEPVEEWTSVADPRETYDPELYEGYRDLGSWPRHKRALDSPGDDLETAEQVLFRPTFRYKHLVKQREEQHRQKELRRQFTHNSPVAAPSSSKVVTSLPPTRSSLQRKYYSAYPQQKQKVYTPQVSSGQRVYSPQVSPVRAVYSPQISTANRVYSANSRQTVPNYYSRITSPQYSPQYPHALQYSQNQVYRPQRSPYAYQYSQRLN